MTLQWPDDFPWDEHLQAAEAAGDDRPTWAYDWPAGQRFAAELSDLVPLAGKTVLELGCGRGRLGLTAAMAGAKKVICTDASAAALAYVQATAEHNKLADTIICMQHRWGDALESMATACDVVLGGDILYRPECFQELVQDINSCCQGGATAYLVDPRQHIEENLFALLHQATLQCEQKRQEAGYTLITISQA